MKSYKSVGNSTWLSKDFVKKNIEISRYLFTPESLQELHPKPKSLDVYALLSGLSFPEYFTAKLVEVQLKISEVLGNRLHYFVAPFNMGVEYCVFKWPIDPWCIEWENFIQELLMAVQMQAFEFHIMGIQVNPDGCIIARGFDECATLFRIRALLKANIPFLPARQSAWAHIPLGRILEPIGSKRFILLAKLIESMSENRIVSTKISCMKFIHETRWYMEERVTLKEYLFTNTKDRDEKL